MANFSAQNIVERAKRVGQQVQTYAEETAQDVRNFVEDTANISVEGIESAVEGKASEILSATVDPLLDKVNGLPKGLVDYTRNVLSNVYGDSGLPPLRNVLSSYASYNYIFTLGCLTNFEINYPEITYRKREPSVQILRSGGGAGSKKVTTEFEKPGRVEYYIDDIEIQSLVVPSKKTRHTNATFLTFKVTEPYSMGLFLQTLDLAAIKAGHKNYIKAPFLLTLEFRGWDDQGNQHFAPQSRRLFPLKLVNVTFNVTDQGTEYLVEAIPWHESGFSDEVQKTKTDISLKGSTVAEILQSGGNSLATIVNGRLLELEQAGQVSTADQYVILFPKDENVNLQAMTGDQESNDGATDLSSKDPNSAGMRELSEDRRQEVYESLTGIQNGEVPADFDAYLSDLLGIVVRRSNIGEAIRQYAEKEENISDVGRAKIVKSFLDGGEVPFGRPSFSEVEGQPGVFARGNITISDEGRTITFKSGTKIQNIIEEVILLSEYGRQLSKAEPDENGMIPWFKIEVDVYNVSDSAQINSTGDYPKVYVYKVVPYFVNEMRFNSPTKPTPGLKNLKRQAIKEYNYIYTGKNQDVLEFDIQIDTAFFLAISNDRGQAHADAKKVTSNRMAAQGEEPKFKTNSGNTDNKSSSGSAGVADSNQVDKPSEGSGGEEHPETRIARDFNNAIVNSPTDLVNMQMTIWGDPYFIADSGMGNYNSKPVQGLINLTEDGSMNYQRSEVDVLVNFRTPIDIGDDGYMDFPGLGTQPVGAFSGLYQVISCTNNFSGGKFTQDLTMIRRRNQEEDIKSTGVKGGNKVLQEGGQEASIVETEGVPPGRSDFNIQDVDQSGRIRGGL